MRLFFNRSSFLKFRDILFDSICKDGLCTHLLTEKRKRKMIRLASFILLFTVVAFQVNSLAQDLPTGAIAQINIDEGPINAIAYSQSANRLAVAAAESIHIYDGDTYKKLIVFAGHTDSVLALAFSPNGKLLVSGSSDETLRLWNADTGELLRTREEHTGSVNAVAFSADGEKFWSGSNEDPAIRSWFSLDGGRASKKVDTHDIIKPTDVFTATVFSSDGETVVKASTATFPPVGDGFFISLSGAYNSYIFAEHSDPVNVLTLYVKSEILATGSADKAVQLWNIESDDPTKPLHILSGHTGSITTMDFSAHGKFLASGSSDKTIRLWDVATGQHLYTLTGHMGEIGAVTLLGDKALASGSSDGTVCIWDLDKIISSD